MKGKFKQKSGEGEAILV